MVLGADLALRGRVSCTGTTEQVEQNLASAARSGVGTMSEEELVLIVRVREAYRALCAILCTACQYCLPCPQGVAIPGRVQQKEPSDTFLDAAILPLSGGAILLPSKAGWRPALPVGL